MRLVGPWAGQTSSQPFGSDSAALKQLLVFAVVSRRWAFEYSAQLCLPTLPHLIACAGGET